MRINVSATLAMLLIIAAVSVVPASAQTQSASSTQPGAELALTYNYLHTNAPPSLCLPAEAVPQRGGRGRSGDGLQRQLLRPRPHAH